jgi:hypothetical protein
MAKMALGIAAFLAVFALLDRRPLRAAGHSYARSTAVT